MSCAIEFDKIGVRGELADIVCRLGSVAAKLSFEISLGALEGDLAAGVGENAGGDGQKALDVIADDYFFAALKDTSVKYYASEEQDDAVIANENGAYGLAIDPLDGSSNIDVNVSIGTIFSIMPALETAEATFLREGHEQLAAGYFVFGPQTALVITFGEGTHQFIYDRRAERYRYVGPMSIATKTKEFAINASNHRHWPVPIRSYVDDCLAGKTGPRDENYNMRWIASLVAETHRILCRGGVFLYPGDDRDGYAKGRLRMVYECAPIAMIVEQAGGQATNAEERLLDQKVDTLHGRTGLVFGSAEEVERVAHYHSLPPSETSPLFGNRGLFALI